ncbi:hypothetical protein ACFV0C_30130 [Streptomyces sp. NPDC059568]|uniref:hypothetical protein n=1 Tax=Streptomyces sp. NPDC059568 TaxID=3346868 RepID=UPI00369BDBDB
MADPSGERPPVHFLRQRRAMRKLLCQVCGGQSDRTDDGTLWVVGEDADYPELHKPGYVTTHPPLCVPCAITPSEPARTYANAMWRCA